MIIKNWMELKIASDMNGGFLVSVDGIERETEKAYLLRLTWAWTSDIEKSIKHWVPKSATMTEEEFDKEQEAFEERMQSGLEYNAILKEFARANGVKGIRERMRTETLLQKIASAGLTAPARA